MASSDPPRPGPHVLVIFGATGDLAARKLFPGLLGLQAAGLLPEEFRVIGSGRHAAGSDDEFREEIAEAVREHAGDAFDEEGWKRLAERLSFVASSAQDGEDLAAAVAAAEEEIAGGDGDEEPRRLLYLSVPPDAMFDMVDMLAATGLTERARVIVEKPFGTDLDSAKELNAKLHESLDEDQIFRIDHFLGKEAIRNLLAFRFANGLFEPAWNRDHIAYVQIDVPEELGLEGRGSFYESTGAFRDMIVTHLAQMAGFAAMEPPVHLSARELRNEKAKVFEAMRPFGPRDTVFGQFEGYREEEDVDRASRVETFVAIRVEVDNWRWAGVPFLLRTGKALASTGRCITIGLRDPSLGMFGESVTGEIARTPNELVFDLSDEARICAEIRAKVPGAGYELGVGAMTLDFGEAFAGDEPLEAYERLLHDVLVGDHTMFTRADEVERLWALAGPILEDPPEPVSYKKGSWGPEEAEELAGPQGWRLSRGE